MLAILGLETGVFLALIMFAVFIGLILTGYNVAYCFAGTALAFAFIGDLTDTFNPDSLRTLPTQWFSSFSDPTLLSVPLFVLMGAILERSGLAERLLTAFGLVMGNLRGGVAAAVVVVGTLLAAATGVVAATVIVMGILSLPAMLRLGYNHQLATGAIVASGTLAQLIPPSLVLILISQQMGVGILGLFAAAFIPGIMLATLYAIYVLVVSWLKPSYGPAMTPEQRRLAGNPTRAAKVEISIILAVLVALVFLLISPRTSLMAGALTLVVTLGVLLAGKMLVAEVLVSIVPALVLIIGVLTAIFQGVATPSESGAVGVFGALLLGLTNKRVSRLLRESGATHIDDNWGLTWSGLRTAGVSTANICVLVLTLLFASKFFSAMFFQLGGSDQMSTWLSSIGGGKWGFVIVAMIAIFLLGINLEFIEITFIVVPIFVPAMDLLGFTPDEKLWFAVLMAVNLNIAFISPPVGFSLFYLQSVKPPEVKTADIHKGALPFMGLQIVALVVLMVFPQITQFSLELFT